MVSFFFTLFLFGFLSLSLQSALKRNNDCCNNSSEIAEDCIVKKPRTGTAENEVAPKLTIHDIPIEVVAYILSFNAYSFSTSVSDTFQLAQFPFLCKSFYVLSKMMNPIIHAKFRFPSLALSALNSRPLALKLLNIDEKFFSSRPKVGSSLDSYLGSSLAIIQNRTADFVKELLKGTNPHARGVICNALQRAFDSENIELIARLILMLSEASNPFKSLSLLKLSNTIYPLYLKSPQAVEKLCEFVPASRLVGGLITYPVPANFILNLKESKKTIQQYPYSLYVNLCCALTKEKKSEDPQHASKLYARNQEILRSVVVTRGKEFACMQFFEFLNNYLYNPSFTKIQIMASIKVILFPSASENDMKVRKFRHGEIGNELLRVAIVNDEPELFQVVARSKRYGKKSKAIADVLAAHPEFASKITYSNFKSIVGVGDPLQLAEFRLKKQMHPPIDPSSKISRVNSMRIKSIHSTNDDYLESFGLLSLYDKAHSLLWLINDLADPAELFVKSLKLLGPNIYHVIYKMFSEKNWDSDLRAKLFKSLLRTESINLESDIGFQISINSSLANALIDDREISQLRHTPRYKTLIRKLLLGNFHAIKFEKWTTERLVDLFQALHFPISFKRFSKINPHAQKLIDDPSGYLELGADHFSVDILPCLTYFLVNKCDLIEKSPFSRHFLTSSAIGEPVKDPLLLRTFPLLNLWRLTDWESFFLKAPFVDAFYPKLDESTVTGFFKQLITNPDLFEKVLRDYRGTELIVRVDSAEQAITFIGSFLLLIPEAEWEYIKFRFNFDYQDIYPVENPPSDGILIVPANEAHEKLIDI